MTAILAGGGGARSDYFVDYPYTGTGASLAVTNTQNLSSDGGMVLCKLETGGTGDHGIFDTVRGTSKLIRGNSSAAEATVSGITAFNTNGFTLGTDTNYNASSTAFMSFGWLDFPRFFKVVTYTGNGSTQNIAHGLDAIPVAMIIKNLSNSADWAVYHASIGNTLSKALNTAISADTSAGYWNNTTPTASQFTVGNNSSVNANGDLYVAYLFAELPGTTKVGAYAAAGPSVSITGLGFTPSYVLACSATTNSPWRIAYKNSGNDYNFRMDSSNARDASGLITLDANGFSVLTTDSAYPNNGTNIYIAGR